MHLESSLALKERRADVVTPGPSPASPAASVTGALAGAGASRRSLRGTKTKGPKARPTLGEVGRRQTLNVFAADGRDVSAEVGSEEAVVDETAFVKQPAVIFTRGKKGMHYTLLLLDYHKDEGSAPHHRLHWLITDIAGEEFAKGDLRHGIILADFEAPRLPRAGEPRLYVLMVFEQRPATPPNTPEEAFRAEPLATQAVQGPLGRHPDLQQFLGDRDRFPLTAWLRSNSPKMARIAACQQFRAHLGADDQDLSGPLRGLHPGMRDRAEAARDSRDDQGALADVEDAVDSEHSADERTAGRAAHSDDADKENQRKSKRGKLSRLRRLLRMKQRCPV